MEFSVFGYLVTAWQLFLSIGLLLAIFEIFAPGFILLPIGIALILSAPMAYFLTDWLTQFVVLGINLIVIFWWFKFFIKNKIIKSNYKSNADSLIGQIAEVTEEINFTKTGYVKLYGDRWQARTRSENSFLVGEQVKIIELDGNKVIIDKI